jgi:predicted RNase H-like nuclease (RuvC/YqgF family)
MTYIPTHKYSILGSDLIAIANKIDDLNARNDKLMERLEKSYREVSELRNRPEPTQRTVTRIVYRPVHHTTTRYLPDLSSKQELSDLRKQLDEANATIKLLTTKSSAYA